VGDWVVHAWSSYCLGRELAWPELARAVVLASSWWRSKRELGWAQRVRGREMAGCLVATCAWARAAR
jgi:hypothetical protein